MLEVSHLAGSVIGLGLLILARALFRRVQAAYHIVFWLLVAGIIASLLKGLDFEEAIVLALVLGVLALGRRRVLPSDGDLSRALQPRLGREHHRRHRHWPSGSAFWSIATSSTPTSCGGLSRCDANAPRMLRASLAVVVLAAAYLHVEHVAPGAAGARGGRAAKTSSAPAPSSNRSDHSLANAALTGDKRLLFNDAGDAFVMYQMAGRSWIALGDPVGSRAGAEELVWRFREISDRHGGQTVFYQASGERLPLYVDLGLAPLKIGEEARVPLADFSLEGSARADTAARAPARASATAPHSRSSLPVQVDGAAAGAATHLRFVADEQVHRREAILGGCLLARIPAQLSDRAWCARGYAGRLRQPVDLRHAGGAVPSI